MYPSQAAAQLIPSCWNMHCCMQATMHAEMDAINSIVASLPDEERDIAFHRQCPAIFGCILLVSSV